MFFNFIDELRAAGIKASFKEHLTLLEALDKDVIEQTPEAFYYLSRATFVKDEGLLDRFDQVFNKVFKGLLTDYGQQPVDIPEDWLKQVAERFETNSNGYDKAPEASRPETAGVKAEQKPAAAQPQVQPAKAAAELPTLFTCFAIFLSGAPAGRFARFCTRLNA